MVPKKAGHETVVLRASIHARVVFEIAGGSGRSEKVCAAACLVAKTATSETKSSTDMIVIMMNV
jgi:hypothetical protein